MDSRKFILKETLLIFLGEILCVAAMIGIFALLRLLDSTVVLGGILGGILATANFFFMAIGADAAADKAENQNVKGGKNAIRSSFLVRTLVLFIVLFALVKSGLCNSIAAVLPLIFVKPIIMVSEFFRKKGDGEV